MLLWPYNSENSSNLAGDEGKLVSHCGEATGRMRTNWMVWISSEDGEGLGAGVLGSC